MDVAWYRPENAGGAGIGWSKMFIKCSIMFPCNIVISGMPHILGTNPIYQHRRCSQKMIKKIGIHILSAKLDDFFHRDAMILGQSNSEEDQYDSKAWYGSKPSQNPSQSPQIGEHWLINAYRISLVPCCTFPNPITPFISLSLSRSMQCTCHCHRIEGLSAFWCLPDMANLTYPHQNGQLTK